MLVIKTEVRNSPIHGIGLYAAEFVPKDGLIWKFAPVVDLTFSARQLRRMDRCVQEFLYVYSYLDRALQKYILSFDHDRFTNHSDVPNTISRYRHKKDVGITIAARDILPGEEITGDYSEFDRAWRKKLIDGYLLNSIRTN